MIHLILRDMVINKLLCLTSIIGLSCFMAVTIGCQVSVVDFLSSEIIFNGQQGYFTTRIYAYTNVYIRAVRVADLRFFFFSS